jgi:hypothetical protein
MRTAEAKTGRLAEQLDERVTGRTSIPDLIVAAHAAFRDDLATRAEFDLGQALLQQGPYTVATSGGYSVTYAYLDTPPWFKRWVAPTGEVLTEERQAHAW